MENNKEPYPWDESDPNLLQVGGLYTYVSDGDIPALNEKIWDIPECNILREMLKPGDFILVLGFETRKEVHLVQSEAGYAYADSYFISVKVLHGENIGYMICFNHPNMHFAFSKTFKKVSEEAND